MQQPPLTLAAVRARLGCSDATVRRLDSVLAPTRDAYGRRTYDADVVERVAAARNQSKAMEP